MKCDNRATILVLPGVLDRGRGFFVACDSCWAKFARSGAFRGAETVPLSAYSNFVGMPEARCGDGDGVDREDGRDLAAIANDYLTKKTGKTFVDLSDSEKKDREQEIEKWRSDIYAFNQALATQRSMERQTAHTHKLIGWVAVGALVLAWVLFHH